LGFHLAIGRIALPNDASVRLHESFGFSPVGVHHQLGYKHGQWIDVMHTELLLAPPAGLPGS
jgi:phosphinothricin acetyltransferase